MNNVIHKITGNHMNSIEMRVWQKMRSVTSERFMTNVNPAFDFMQSMETEISRRIKIQLVNLIRSAFDG